MRPLNPLKTASFDVDAQKTFTPLCPNELAVPGGDEIVAELNAQAHFAGFRLGSKDAHSPQAVWVANGENAPLSPVAGEPNADLHWPLHAVPGTLGFELLDGLPTIPSYHFFVWKGVEPNMHPYGACYHDLAERMSTGVIEFLRANEVETVIVGGLALDYCVKNTVLQLRRAGFHVIVNLAACRGVSEVTSDKALDEMAFAGADFVMRAAELLERSASLS